MRLDIKISLVILICGLALFLWFESSTMQPPEEKARIERLERQARLLDRQNKLELQELRRQQIKLEQSKEIVSKTFGIADVEAAYNQGDFIVALDKADTILSGNPDAATIYRIASICEKIAETKPTGEIAERLYKVSDKGQRLTLAK
ncbi:MAG: hypothetical protein ABRQ24_00605 [Syntrophomonadaceae bacterium]